MKFLRAQVQKTNVQMCKCAKNRRAQNAQICSANYFPNAEITNLHCAQKHKCKFHTCTIFPNAELIFRCVLNLFLQHVRNLIYIIH